PTGEAALGRELDACARRVGQAEAVRAVVGEEARDRIPFAAAGEPARDVEHSRAQLQREGAPAAGARELVQEAAVAAGHHALRSATAGAAPAAGASAPAPGAPVRAIAAASRPARRPLSSATPRPLRSRAGSKPPSRSPAAKTFASGTPSAPSGRSRASVRTPAAKSGCSPS